MTDISIEISTRSPKPILEMPGKPSKECDLLADIWGIEQSFLVWKGRMECFSLLQADLLCPPKTDLISECDCFWNRMVKEMSALK